MAIPPGRMPSARSLRGLNFLRARRRTSSPAPVLSRRQVKKVQRTKPSVSMMRNTILFRLRERATQIFVTETPTSSSTAANAKPCLWSRVFSSAISPSVANSRQYSFPASSEALSEKTSRTCQGLEKQETTASSTGLLTIPFACCSAATSVPDALSRPRSISEKRTILRDSWAPARRAASLLGSVQTLHATERGFSQEYDGRIGGS